MQKIFIKNRQGQKVAVVIYENPESKGLVFVMHGLGGFKEQPHIQAMADAFQAQGFTTILFDTTNSLGESDGNYQEATMENYYNDFVDVIAWAKGQSWYKEPFLLAGHSLGGYSVLRYAEEYPECVKAVFSWAPVASGKFSYEATERSGGIEEWKETGWRVRLSNSKEGVELRLPWSHMLERQKHDLFPKANKLVMPIAIIVGDEDTSCPLDQQEVLFEAIPSENKELIVVKNAPHTFREGDHLSELKEKLVQWLKKLK